MGLMATSPTLYGSGETSDDAVRKPQTKDEPPKVDPLVSLYHREIERYNRATSDWYQEGGEIENLYLDEDRANKTGAARRFAMLWANVQTLAPAVYTKPPTVVCSRRYKDRDPVARIAAELVERSTNTTFELYGVDEVFKASRDDRLIPGRGQVWVRYEAEIERYEYNARDHMASSPGIGHNNPPMRERLKSEHVCVDYVHWKDFGHNVARTWKDVWLVWRVCFKTQDEMAERFGSEKAAKLSYNAKAPAYGSMDSANDPDGRCKIFEIWDKTRRKVSWLVEGHKTFLESGPPPIDFRDGFPCPEPCFATKTSKQLIPTPDYRYYRDQAKEINDLTDKIGNMCKWLIVKGFVPGAPSGVADPIEEAIRDTSNREMVQTVESMMEWSEKGGINKLIDWFPIEAVVKAIEAAINVRAQLVQDVFQITGVSDILRGQTDPRETLGAQELKAQTGSHRLKNTKDEVARFCRDVARLTAEVIAEKFEPESIAAITGYKYISPEEQMRREMMAQQAAMAQQQPMMMGGPMAPNVTPMPGVSPMLPPQMGHNGGPDMGDEDGEDQLEFDDRAMALLRDDKLRNFRIDIETDSTVTADENAEKQNRVEFLTAIGGFLKSGAEIAQIAPDLTPVMQELLMFAARGFHVGRSVEETMERAFKKANDTAKERAKNPPPDPNMVKAQVAKELGEAKIQQGQQQMQLDKQKSDQEMAIKAQEFQFDSAIKQKEAEIDLQVQQTKAANDAQMQQQKMALEARMGQQQMQLSAAEGEQRLQQSRLEGQQSLQQSKAAGDQKLQLADAAAKQKVKQAAMSQPAKGGDR
jgi:hypothetical protein